MDEIRESVRIDILEILDNVISILEEKEDKDLYEIKELSNHTIHSASIYQDSDSISTAILIYSLYKIIERKALDEKSYGNVEEEMKYARLYLKENRLHEYKKSMSKLFTIVASADRNFTVFIQQVIEKARINKGSKLYEHGLSVAKAAELMGLSQWELMSYIGKTELGEAAAEPAGALLGGVNVKKRMAVAMKAFNLEG